MLPDEVAEASDSVAAYQRALATLPQPKDKKLRYLAISLAVLGNQARMVAGARTGVLDAMNRTAPYKAGSPAWAAAMKDWTDRETSETEIEDQFVTDVTEAAVAERLALGTSTIHDAIEVAHKAIEAANYVSPAAARDSSQRRDSIYSAAWRRGRAAIDALR